MDKAIDISYIRIMLTQISAIEDNGRYYAITIFEDGSGHVSDDIDGDIVFGFSNLAELPNEYELWKKSARE